MKRGKMSQDIVLDNFRKMFTEDSSRGRKEHLIAVDENGFTYALNHGQKGFVGYSRSEVAGKFVIHNHPNDSVFSRQDLREMKKDTSILSKAEQGNFRSCSTILKVSVDVAFHDIGGGNPMIRHRIAT